jgi:hypothetical protein
MNSARKYKIADVERRRRLRQLTDDPIGLSREIGIARLLLEESLESSPVFANVILQTLGKLTEQHVKIEIQQKNLLSVDEVRALALKIGDAVLKHLRRIPNYESIVEAIVQDIADDVAQITQPTIQHPLLGGPDASSR